jgi:protoporphyrin/coproporphyrin ferrochelatase
VSDHMEVRHDLDVEARQVADRLGLPLERAATPGTDPRFVSMVTELVREQVKGAGDVAGGIQPAALGRLGAACDACPAGCCAPPRPPSSPPAGT